MFGASNPLNTIHFDLDRDFDKFLNGYLAQLQQYSTPAVVPEQMQPVTNRVGKCGFSHHLWYSSCIDNSACFCGLGLIETVAVAVALS